MCGGMYRRRVVRRWHTYRLAELLDSAVSICRKTVTAAHALVEIEQVFIVRLVLILVEQWLYNSRNTHLHVRLVSPELHRLGALVVYHSPSMLLSK